jgi:hypothetical protein
MASANPPIDRAAAAENPEFVLEGDGMKVGISAHVDCAPVQDCGFRFVLLDEAGGRRYAGYVWEEE